VGNIGLGFLGGAIGFFAWAIVVPLCGLLVADVGSWWRTYLVRGCGCLVIGLAFRLLDKKRRNFLMLRHSGVYWRDGGSEVTVSWHSVERIGYDRALGVVVLHLADGKHRGIPSEFYPWRLRGKRMFDFIDRRWQETMANEVGSPGVPNGRAG